MALSITRSMVHGSYANRFAAVEKGFCTECVCRRYFVQFTPTGDSLPKNTWYTEGAKMEGQFYPLLYTP